MAPPQPAPAPPPEPDRAIVIGIANYPNFGPNGAGLDLQGPVKDATDVANWLVTKANAHVTLITSTGSGGLPASAASPAITWTTTDLRPNQQDVRDSFVSYLRSAICQPMAHISRRLYVYMAGHGFAPEPLQLSLVMADALSDLSVPNIEATSWINWFADQLYFDELVLWMDCCATRTFSYEGGKPLFRKTATRANGRAKVFMAFAAGPSQLSYEGPVPPNYEIRGLFTDKLLRGLNGAAVGPDGVVRSSDLANFLRGRPATAAPATPLSEPTFPFVDDMVLATPTLPTYLFRAALPEGEILKIQTWKDGVETDLFEAPVHGGVVPFALAIGYYKASSASLGSKLFAIDAATGNEVSLA
jgi:Caspase domain